MDRRDALARASPVPQWRATQCQQVLRSPACGPVAASEDLLRLQNANEARPGRRVQMQEAHQSEVPFASSDHTQKM